MMLARSKYNASFVNFLIHERPSTFSWNSTEEHEVIEETIDIETQFVEGCCIEQNSSESIGQLIHKRKYKGNSKL